MANEDHACLMIFLYNNPTYTDCQQLLFSDGPVAQCVGSSIKWQQAIIQLQVPPLQHPPSHVNMLQLPPGFSYGTGRMKLHQILASTSERAGRIRYFPPNASCNPIQGL